MRSREASIHTIQKLSAEERTRQPEPEEWLRLHDQALTSPPSNSHSPSASEPEPEPEEPDKLDEPEAPSAPEGGIDGTDGKA